MTGPVRVAVLPPVPALLAARASLEDPVPALRAACAGAVAWLAQAGPVRVLAEGDQARRIGVELAGGHAPDGPAWLVLLSGTACRTEKAPGHLDHRAAAYDAALGAALRAGDPAALAGLDRGLGAELLVQGLGLADELAGVRVERAEVDLDDDPFGVQYWVVRWLCES